MKNLLPAIGRSAATILIVALAIVIALWMWNHYERSPWTRDGRVRADVVRVTPDIGGLVTSVAVRDNQPVKAGDLLFVIDRPRYSLAVEQGEASVASARATLGQAQREASRDLALGDRRWVNTTAASSPTNARLPSLRFWSISIARSTSLRAMRIAQYAATLRLPLSRCGATSFPKPPT